MLLICKGDKLGDLRKGQLSLVLNSTRLKGTGGFSLIQGLVAISLLAIVSLLFATMVTNQFKMIRHVEQKSEMLDIRNHLLNTFSESDVCSCQLNPDLTTDSSNDPDLRFDSCIIDGSQSIDVKKIKSGCEIDAPVVVEEGQKLPSGIGGFQDRCRIKFYDAFLMKKIPASF